MKLKSTEEITLQALLVALAQIDTALPDHLQQEIHQLGGELAQQKTGAIAQIPLSSTSTIASKSFTRRLDLACNSDIRHRNELKTLFC